MDIKASMDPDAVHEILGQVGEESEFWSEVPVFKRRCQERIGFLRKVYGVLSGQLLLNLLICSIFIHYEPLASFAKACYWTPLVLIVVVFGFKKFPLEVWKKQVPVNYVILAAFILLQSTFLGLIIHLIPLSVLTSIAMILTVTSCLTVYTFQHTRDYSSFRAAIFATVCCVLTAIVMQVYFPKPKQELLAIEFDHSVVLAAVAAFLLCLTIVAYTHIIMWDLAPQDYIEASVRLSPDCFYVLLFIFYRYMVDPGEEEWG